MLRELINLNLICLNLFRVSALRRVKSPQTSISAHPALREQMNLCGSPCWVRGFACLPELCFLQQNFDHSAFIFFLSAVEVSFKSHPWPWLSVHEFLRKGLRMEVLCDHEHWHPNPWVKLHVQGPHHPWSPPATPAPFHSCLLCASEPERRFELQRGLLCELGPLFVCVCVYTETLVDFLLRCYFQFGLLAWASR